MTYRLPAEWEPQDFVLLTWPNETTDWAPYLEEIRQTVAEMVRAIARHEEVMLLSMFKTDVPDELREMPNVYVAELPNNDTWARDFGPIVLKGSQSADSAAEGGASADDEEEEKDYLWLDFRFNGWGEKFEAAWDNMIPYKLWALYGFFEDADYEDHQDFVLEGGSIEADGRGTLFTTSQCLLAPHRNQPLTKEQIEEQLKRRLRVGRVAWLDYGNLVGDDTDGHIDTIVRCAPDDTLVYVGCDDPADEQYADFHALEEQLKALRTADGKPYRLLRLPMPDGIYEVEGDCVAFQSSNVAARRSKVQEVQGERLPATYANFLVINGAVLVPTYDQPEKDAEALRVVQQAFPDREMIPIDARTIIRQHGSVHCLTMQVPK
jgi:agmatine/peptidylarginine deiminase